MAKTGGKWLKSLLASTNTAKSDIAGINEGLKEEVQAAVERHQLNKKVFSVIAKLDRMEPEQLRAWLDTFDQYLELSGLQSRAEAVQPMEFEEGDEATPSEENATGEARGGNVRGFPAPKSVSAE